MGMLYHCFYCDCVPNALRTFYISFVRLFQSSTGSPPCKDIVGLKAVQRFATKVCTKACEGVNYV